MPSPGKACFFRVCFRFLFVFLDSHDFMGDLGLECCVDFCLFKKKKKIESYNGGELTSVLWFYLVLFCFDYFFFDFGFVKMLW